MSEDERAYARLALLLAVPGALYTTIQIRDWYAKPVPAVQAPVIPSPKAQPAAAKPKPATTGAIPKKPVREPTWFEKTFELQQGTWPQRDPSTRD